MTQPPRMPATLDALEHSLHGLAPGAVQQIARFAQASSQPFRELIDPVLERLAGVVPSWPLLAEWNEWCLANRASFFVWRPERGGPTERQRLEALVHTIMMIAAKERNVATFRGSNIAEVEVLMAGDDAASFLGSRRDPL